jgi:hypothetical protein
LTKYKKQAAIKKCGEKMISGNRICGKCGAKEPANEMRYSIDGKRIICAKCQAIESGGVKGGTTQPTKLMGRDYEEPEPRQASVNYYCSNCRFKFSRNSKIDIRICPYCSKETISIVPKQTAQAFINKAGREEE